MFGEGVARDCCICRSPIRLNMGTLIRAHSQSGTDEPVVSVELPQVVPLTDDPAGINRSSIATRYGVHMRTRAKVLTIVIGAVVAIAGAIVTTVYIFQPWRSCPYDDTPSACAMLPADATVMSIAMFGTLVGLVIVALGLFVRADQSQPLRVDHSR